MIDVLSTDAGTGKTAQRRKRTSIVQSQALQFTERVLPQSIMAEQGVLGCVLLSPSDNLDTCIKTFRKGGEVFYDLRHRIIFDTLTEMYDAKQPIDLLTLQEKLKMKGQLATIGGIPYLVALSDAVPSAANLEYYVEIISEKFILRQIIQACTSVVGRVYGHDGKVDELLDEVERDILQISEERVENTSMLMKELVHRAINTIEDFHQRQGMLTGIGTGFVDFDKMTSGLHGGEMIVIAARPSMGKTSLAMNIVEHVVLEEKRAVGVFSLEMTAESLILRMLCSRARINMRSIRDGFLAERDFPKLTAAAGQLAHVPLYVDDTAGLSILQLRAKARRMHQQYGVEMIVIDYLQLLSADSSRIENRQQEIAQISNGLKALAKELRIPVIVLSQLNRALEKDNGRKPRLSDLRESGAIEQDADLVALLYNDERKDDECGTLHEDDALPVKLLIAKQRNGPTGEVNLTFLKGFTRFESAPDFCSVPECETET
jgi:replicative DNA helicase